MLSSPHGFLSVGEARWAFCNSVPLTVIRSLSHHVKSLPHHHEMPDEQFLLLFHLPLASHSDHCAQFTASLCRATLVTDHESGVEEADEQHFDKSSDGSVNVRHADARDKSLRVNPEDAHQACGPRKRKSDGREASGRWHRFPVPEIDRTVRSVQGPDCQVSTETRLSAKDRDQTDHGAIVKIRHADKRSGRGHPDRL